MLFDSPAYVIFLTLVAFLYWRLRFQSQNRFLLIASYFFYGWWDYRFLLLMICSTLFDYYIGLRIGTTENQRERKALLTFSLILNFSFLAYFKYSNFFLDSLVQALTNVGVQNVPVHFLKVILPPGISFYTFQEVAYIVDVYKRRLEPAKSLVEYALFISLFPHLIAGPIQRPGHLLPQVQQPRQWNASMAFDGLLLILEGLFRKCVVADQCSLIANAVFSGRLGTPTIPLVLLGMWAFAWQIYGDFSGYSNIARGSAQLLGFHFMVNFRQPYLATSLQDFWRRWHISLSTWLRDYLYIPLGGNRNGTAQTYRNLFLTMLLGGLWHGANWTFVVWGALHGGGLALERFKGVVDVPSGRQTFGGKWLRRIVIFHLVCLAWVFFRADSVSSALHLLGGLTVWHWQPAYSSALQVIAVFTIPLFLLDLWLERTGDEYFLQSQPLSPRLAFATAAFLVVTFFAANQANAFIYFQF